MARSSARHGRSREASVITWLHEQFSIVGDGKLFHREGLAEYQRFRNCATDAISLAQIISDYRRLYPEFIVIPERNKGWRRVLKPEGWQD